MDEMTITLKDERPPSWNRYYSGLHWRNRQSEAERIHLLVKYALGGQLVRIVKPVEIAVTVYFKGKQFDPDNIPAKLYIDGLVRAGLLVNDTPRYVDSVTTRSRADRLNPRVEITLREVAA